MITGIIALLLYLEWGACFDCIHSPLLSMKRPKHYKAMSLLYLDMSNGFRSYKVNNINVIFLFFMHHFSFSLSWLCKAL